MGLRERFEAKIDKSGACWEWTGHVSREGYGRIQRGRREEGVAFAHRVAWEFANGAIPEGLTIDHICLNRRCVNPDHLQLLTRSDNGKRAWETSNPADRPYPLADDSQPCKYGHLDWVRSKRNGQRRCAECHRIEARQRAARKRAT